MVAKVKLICIIVYIWLNVDILHIETVLDYCDFLVYIRCSLKINAHFNTIKNYSNSTTLIFCVASVML